MKQYIVDAFTDKIFCGNQAAIIILDEWVEEELMLNITKENNLSETAFAVKEGKKYRLRWFTPGGEIDLCGHATLACAFVLKNYYIYEADEVIFSTLSGDIKVKMENDFFEMEFPAYQLNLVKVDNKIIDAIGKKPLEAYLGRDLVCVLESEEDVLNFKPDKEKIMKLKGLLLHITSKGIESDCVTRSFAPKLNVLEDPVCGSGHCHIAPYWSKKLEKESIQAYQASERGGSLNCRYEVNKVYLSGKAVLFAISEINI